MWYLAPLCLRPKLQAGYHFGTHIVASITKYLGLGGHKTESYSLAKTW